MPQRIAFKGQGGKGKMQNFGGKESRGTVLKEKAC